ncbi:cardiolipin synthase [Leucothrix sargassi]|nr:cardiolipin synthase [Leucothrix sargassi]
MALIITAVQLLGLITAVYALLSTRTAQGTVAWVVTLIAFPWLGIPAYLIFGRTRYKRYVYSRAEGEFNARAKLESVKHKISTYYSPRPQQNETLKAFEVLANLPFTEANHLKLLVNGKATFENIFDGIDEAETYILVQFYIIKDDSLGQQLSMRLQDALARGVSVYLLYDDIGSYQLSDSYIDTLKSHGADVHSFHSHRSYKSRFEVNFRNHRKIIVVDGKHTWIGGHNVGDEYIRRDPAFPNWRDTHIKLSGPAVMGAQHSFIEDWLWVTNKLPELNWQPHVPDSETYQRAVVLPSGPSDTFETASLMMQHAIHIAKQRIWIASPYFVPDEGVQQALRLAALRGVDVRVMIPEKPDNQLIYLSAFAFLPGILRSGVKVMRYKKGFLHQKVFLIDSYLSAVGTTNMDNRSFRLNFEVTTLIDDEGFATEIEEMFLDDFSKSDMITLEEIHEKPLWFRILSRAAYLSAPVQ